MPVSRHRDPDGSLAPPGPANIHEASPDRRRCRSPLSAPAAASVRWLDCLCGGGPPRASGTYPRPPDGFHCPQGQAAAAAWAVPRAWPAPRVRPRWGLTQPPRLLEGAQAGVHRPLRGRDVHALADVPRYRRVPAEKRCRRAAAVRSAAGCRGWMQCAAAVRGTNRGTWTCGAIDGRSEREPMRGGNGLSPQDAGRLHCAGRILRIHRAVPR